MKPFKKHDLQQKYFSLPNDIFQRGCTCVEIAILGYLQSLPDSAKPTLTSVARVLGITPNTLKAHLSKLDAKKINVSLGSGNNHLFVVKTSKIDFEESKFDEDMRRGYCVYPRDDKENRTLKNKERNIKDDPLSLNRAAEALEERYLSTVLDF